MPWCANCSFNPEVYEKVEQLRQEVEEHIDRALKHHEFKMVYIGVVTLAGFVTIIYADWKS